MAGPPAPSRTESRPVPNREGAAVSDQGPVERSETPRAGDEHRAGRLEHLLTALAFLVLAMVFTAGLWPAGAPEHNVQDYQFFLFQLDHGVRVLTEGVNPFYTTQVNAPQGVNLMANTSVLGLGIPLAPLTMLLGGPATYVIMVVVGLAGTAYGWYRVLRRHVAQWPGAALGGLFCGSAPGIISHAQGHPNWTAQLLVPFIVMKLLGLGSRTRWKRDGAVLGLLVAYQVFINEEVLLFTALGVVVFGTSYASMGWSSVRRRVPWFLASASVGAASAVVVVAYPLWVQFSGRQSYHGVPPVVAGYGNDLMSFLAYSTHSVGAPWGAHQGAPNPTEENSHLGLLLIMVVVLGALWLRSRLAGAAVITAVIFAALSLGPEISVSGKVVGAGPWKTVARWPLLDSVVPTRLSLVMVPCIALVLSMLVTRLGAWRWRPLGYAMVLLALVPTLPRPLGALELPVVPSLVTSGALGEYTRDGGSVLVVPKKWSDPAGMRWAAAAPTMFEQPLGYFLGPDARGRGQFGPTLRATHQLLMDVGRGSGRSVNEYDRTMFWADAAYWRVTVIVLAPGGAQHEALERAVTSLVGFPARFEGGLLVWDVPLR